MQTRTRMCFLAGLVALTTCGCLNIRVTAQTKEEALANQIMGMLEDLDEDLAKYESVRGVDPDGQVRTPPEQTESVQRVIAAQQRRQFNSDDIQLFREKGYAGEGNRGLLEFRPSQKTSDDPTYAAFVRAIINQENEDRLALMMRAIEVNETLSESDLGTIQEIFAQQNRDAAEAGVWIQLPDSSAGSGEAVPGKWLQR